MQCENSLLTVTCRGDFLSKLDQQSTVQLQPGRPVVSNAAGAAWRYGQSAEGYFTVWLNDEAQMILTRDGRVWSAQQQVCMLSAT